MKPTRLAPHPGLVAADPGYGPLLPCITPYPARTKRSCEPHGIAQHRIDGYSSKTLKCNKKYAEASHEPSAAGAAAGPAGRDFSGEIYETPHVRRRRRLTSGLRCP